MFIEMHAERGKVCFTKGSLLAIEILKQSLHLTGSLWGRNKRIEMFIESHDPCLVLFPQGINSIVQQGHPAKCLLHNPSLVYHTVNLLWTFILIYIHHKFMPAGTGFPVDCTVVIPLDVLFYLFEFSMMPHTTNTLDSQLRQIITHCQQFIAMQHQIRRIHFNILLLSACITPGEQTYPTGYEYANLSETINSPACRT